MKFKFHLFHYKLIISICCLLLFCLSICNITNLSQIFVLHDEFGYWYNAANMAGYDWTGINGISSYYSYGYSLFLVPLFHIFHSSAAMFKAAIVLNGLLLTGSYLLACRCSFYLFREIRREVLCIFCFLISCYGGFLFSVNITWGEPLLVFLFWLIILTFIKFSQKRSILYLCILVLEGLFLYAIHQRTLGVVGAMIIAGILLLKSSHISLKSMFLFFVIAVCMIGLVFLFKTNLVSSIWSSYINTGTGAANTYSGQMAKILNLFSSWDFFIAVLKGFFAKLFYLCGASGLLILWGVFLIFNKLKNFKNEVPVHLIIGIFCILSTIFMEGISALYFNNTTRLDTVIYGRYAEFTIGPLMLFGLCFLYQKMGTLKSLILGISIYLALSLPAIDLLFHGSGNMYLSSVVGNIFYDLSSDRMNTGYLIVIPLLIGIFIYLLFQYKRKSLYALAMVPLLCLWFYSVYYTLKVDVNPSQSQAAGYERFCKDIEELGEDIPVYYVYREEYGNNNSLIERVQFVLYDRRIQLIFPEEVADLSGDYVLIQYSLSDMDMDQYAVYSQTHGLVAAVPSHSSLYQTALEKQYESSVFDPTDRTNGTELYDGRYNLSTDHKEGFLTCCNYFSLNAGTYEVNLRFSAEDITDDFLGTFDVMAEQGQEELLRADLNASMLDENGYADLTFTFTCDNINFAEYRIYAQSSSLLKLESITYRRIA